MTLKTKLRSPKRTIAAALVVVALAAGAAFALLQVWGVILGNNISVANAGLVVSADGVSYGPAVTGGLSFSNLIPGGYPAPANGYTTYLKNNGNTDLDLSFTLNDPPPDDDPDDLDNINLILTDTSGSVPPKSFSLSSLINKKQALAVDLLPGATQTYKIQAQAGDNAQPGRTIGGIDLAFVGTARDVNAPN